MKKTCFVLLVSLLVSACGRYASPVPPEAMAPGAVVDLQVKAQNDGLELSWKSPRNDVRGQELKSLDGYRVYKALVAEGQEAKADQLQFSLLRTLSDTSVSTLENKKKELRAAGKPSRKASIDAALMQFALKDSELQSGSRYLYKVVPVNQGGLEGERYSLVQVVWSGAQSRIFMVPQSNLDSLFEGQEEF
jgi:multidrug efflux pump subunit AcrA (membrane-fusion protein)